MKSEFKANYQSVVPTTALGFGLITAKNSKLGILLITITFNSMYIHGGRDLKEGTVSSLWRINLTCIQQLQQGMNKPVGWECIQTSAKNDIGKISHHRCAMISANEVVFFGGNKPEGNN